MPSYVCWESERSRLAGGLQLSPAFGAQGPGARNLCVYYGRYATTIE
jgi:hypothetical protein